jgi:hypothetical protein
MNIRHDMICCYVIRRDPRDAAWEFLQIKRRDGDFMGNTWQTVYGGIESPRNRLASRSPRSKRKKPT